MARSGTDLKMAKLLSFKLYVFRFWDLSFLYPILASAAICKNGVLQIGISAMVIENKVKTLSITTFLLLAKKVLRATAFPEYYSSSSNHPIIVPSDSDIEDAFSSTNVPDYFPATPGNTSPDSSNDLTSNLLATLVFSPYYE
ncbi:hypothetical protein Tco_0703908 [Tanacetum coccineum]|uniref:Uncharacterized protein n=1 Tax=Tanacetum coccineum TaxID=301880 RepID=A0ABQ4Y208_9ASTR